MLSNCLCMKMKCRSDGQAQTRYLWDFPRIISVHVASWCWLPGATWIVVALQTTNNAFLRSFDARFFQCVYSSIDASVTTYVYTLFASMCIIKRWHFTVARKIFTSLSWQSGRSKYLVCVIKIPCSKTWTKRSMPQSDPRDIWTYFCWGHMCNSKDQYVQVPWQYINGDTVGELISNVIDKVKIKKNRVLQF